jgi:multidrug resistance efflux pump
LSAIFVTARIDDTAIRDVHLGQQVDITVDAYPDITLTGYVREIQGSSAGVLSAVPQDNTTGRFQRLTQWIPVKITIADPKNLNLVPGMNVTVKIHKN